MPGTNGTGRDALQRRLRPTSVLDLGERELAALQLPLVGACLGIALSGERPLLIGQLDLVLVDFVRALDHFLANEWRNAHAQERGGKMAFISLDDTSAEQRYTVLAASSMPLEQFFEQQWAITLLDTVVSRVRNEFNAAGKLALFEQLKIFLTGEKCELSYGDLAVRLKTTEAAVKMSVSRIRQRYGQLLRAEISNTVESPGDVEEELRALLAALR